MLPKEEVYTPPLSIRVRDNRQFGRKPMVGVVSVKSLQAYRCDPHAEQHKFNVDIPRPGETCSVFLPRAPSIFPLSPSLSLYLFHVFRLIHFLNLLQVL